ncbi:TonB family protein [Oxalobacteraceae bacterium A2-2]
MNTAWATTPVITNAVADFNSCARPEWPKEALRKEQTGTVTLSFLIGDDGQVLDALVKKSSGFPLLDQAALESIQRCKFKPRTVNGVAVNGWTPMQYVWSIDSKETKAQAIATAQQYRDAAAAGDPAAMHKLALMFNSNTGIQPSADSYLKLLQASATRGYAEAQYDLANSLMYGIKQPKNVEQAVAWYRKAAEQGHVQAQTKLATLYNSGQGVARDPSQAAIWYRKAADQGDAGAAYRLGRMFESGSGVEQSYAEAAALYRRGAEAGSSEAQERLANLYLQGRGVEKDEAQAAGLLRKAAEQREPGAEAALARLYFAGAGVPRDDAEGAKYLRRAARGGDFGAIRLLAEKLASGEIPASGAADSATWTAKAAAVSGLPQQE